MRPATLPFCRQRLGVLTLVVAAASLCLLFGLPVAGFLVVGAGFGMAGYGLASVIVPNRTVLDRLLATITLAAACFAVVAEALSLLTLLGSATAWIVAATACGVVFGALPGRSVMWAWRLTPQGLSQSPTSSPAPSPASGRGGADVIQMLLHGRDGTR